MPDIIGVVHWSMALSWGEFGWRETHFPLGFGFLALFRKGDQLLCYNKRILGLDYQADWKTSYPFQQEKVISFSWSITLGGCSFSIKSLCHDHEHSDCHHALLGLGHLVTNMIMPNIGWATTSYFVYATLVMVILKLEQQSVFLKRNVMKMSQESACAKTIKP